MQPARKSDREADGYWFDGHPSEITLDENV
jgi:hypothetical protein